MAKINKAAEQAVRRAKAAGAQARRQSGQLATRWPGKLSKGREDRRASAGAGSCSGYEGRREDHRTHPEAEEGQGRGDCCRRRRCGSSRRRGRGQPPQAVERTLAAPALPLGSTAGLPAKRRQGSTNATARHGSPDRRLWPTLRSRGIQCPVMIRVPSTEAAYSNRSRDRRVIDERDFVISDLLVENSPRDYSALVMRQTRPRCPLRWKVDAESMFRGRQSLGV
jgi:hypothetical protein